MHHKHLIWALLLIGFPFRSTVHAQVVGTFHAVKIEQKERPMAHYVERRFSIPVGDRIIEAVKVKTKRVGGWVLELRSFDANTGSFIKETAIPWDDERNFDALLEWNDELLIVTFEYLEPQERLDIYGQILDIHDLAADTPAFKIGEIAGVLEGSYTLGLKFARSPNGSKLLILHDGVKNIENEDRILYCWVLDRTTGPDWHGGYLLELGSDFYSTSDHLIDDEGRVHIASREQNENVWKAISRQTHSYTISTFHGEDRTDRTFPLTGEQLVVAMSMEQTGDRIIAAGFLSDDVEAQKTTSVFRADFSKEIGSKMEFLPSSLPEPIPAFLTTASSAISDDGTVFLTGADRKLNSFTVMVSEHIISCAIDTHGTLLYATHIPRANLTHTPYQEHMTLTDGEHAILLFPDNDKNLEAYRQGKEPKANRDHTNPVVQVMFEENGAPVFSRLEVSGLEILFSTFHPHYPSLHPFPPELLNNGVVFMHGAKMISKKEIEPWRVFWRLEEN